MCPRYPAAQRPGDADLRARAGDRTARGRVRRPETPGETRRDPSSPQPASCHRRSRSACDTAGSAMKPTIRCACNQAPNVGGNRQPATSVRRLAAQARMATDLAPVSVAPDGDDGLDRPAQRVTCPGGLRRRTSTRTTTFTTRTRRHRRRCGADALLTNLARRGRGDVDAVDTWTRSTRARAKSLLRRSQWAPTRAADAPAEGSTRRSRNGAYRFESCSVHVGAKGVGGGAGARTRGRRHRLTTPAAGRVPPGGSGCRRPRNRRPRGRAARCPHP